MNSSMVVGCGWSPIAVPCGVGVHVHGNGVAVDGRAAAISDMLGKDIVHDIRAIKVLTKCDF